MIDTPIKGEPSDWKGRTVVVSYLLVAIVSGLVAAGIWVIAGGSILTALGVYVLSGHLVIAALLAKTYLTKTIFAK